MLINVQYLNKRFDYVKDNALLLLLEFNEIVRFKRSSGWVIVGVDPVRQFNRGYQNKPNSYHKPVVEVNNTIRIVYNDNRCEYVTDTILDNLLELNKIAKFQRTTGWVTVGVDSIRETKRKHTYYNYPNVLKKRLS